MYGEVGVISMNNAINRGVNTPNNNINNNNNVRVMASSVQNDLKYTENWINIKGIRNGIIYNERNEMVTGIKIRPKNIFILDNSQMDNTLISLMNVYNTIDFEFWLIVADRPVDVAMYQAEMQLLLNKQPTQAIRKLILQDLEKADYFINNDVVDTEYYILFKEKNIDLLQKKVRNLINGMASCGLIASQTSNDDLYMIVDNFLNGGRNFDTGTVMPL